MAVLRVAARGRGVGLRGGEGGREGEGAAPPARARTAKMVPLKPFSTLSTIGYAELT